MANPKVFFDILIDARPAGRIVFELYADTVPKTVENFRALCTGERGVGMCGSSLHYKGSFFHRIMPGFLCHGGDFVKSTGAGGESIWGTIFADESFAGKAGKHTGYGCLSMANSGPNTNNSQFLISFGQLDWLDGKHVVFGRAVEGYDVLRRIEAVGSPSGAPKVHVAILDCGEVE